MRDKEFNELSLDELEQVSGGETYIVNDLHDEYFENLRCPRCGSRVFPFYNRHDKHWFEIDYKCCDCEHEFTVRIQE